MPGPENRPPLLAFGLMAVRTDILTRGVAYVHPEHKEQVEAYLTAQQVKYAVRDKGEFLAFEGQ
jgi:hypothetical protein